MTVDRRLVRSLIAATGATAMLGVTIGLAMIFLSLVLKKQGFGETEIGFSAAVQFLGIMGFAPLAPRIMRRLGLVRPIALSLVVCAACLAGVLPVRVWNSEAATGTVSVNVIRARLLVHILELDIFCYSSPRLLLLRLQLATI